MDLKTASGFRMAQPSKNCLLWNRHKSRLPKRLDKLWQCEFLLGLSLKASVSFNHD
jgi:hypothetical protein